MRARIAVIAGIAVFLTLAGTGIGYALWNASAQATGTVRAASLADSCTSPTHLVGGGFETPAIPNGLSVPAGPGQYPTGWTPAAEPIIEMWRNHNGVAAPEGQQIVELNGNSPGTIYQVVATTPGQTLRWSIEHKGRFGNDTMRVAINKDGDPLVTQQTLTTGTAAFVTYQGVYVVPAGQTSTRISLVSVSATPEPGMNNGGSVGNLIDDVTFGVGPCLTSTAAISNITLPGNTYGEGDVVQYTTTLTNSGGNAANSSVYTATVPAGLVYVPGTISINGATKTDAVGDDQAQIVGTAITARLGQGANAAVGGSIAPANVVTVTFRATIQASAQGGTLSYDSSTAYVDPIAPGWPLTAASQPAPLTTNVAPSADLEVTVETLPQIGPGSGGELRTWTFLVTNNGPSSASGVQVVVTPSAGAPAMVNPRTASVSGGGTCTAFATGSTSSTCTVTGTFASGSSRTITFTGTMPANPANTYSVTAAAASTAASFDPVPSNNSATGSVQFDSQSPSTPINLTATHFSDTRIDLTWQASNDNVGIAGYNIYRNGVLVTTTTGTGTSFSDTGLTSHLPYWYWVQAVDTSGNVSGNSNGAGAVTFALLTSYRVQYVNPAIPAGTQLCVVADANAGGAGIKTQLCGATEALRQWRFTPVSGNDVYVRFDATPRRGWTVPDNNQGTDLRVTANSQDTNSNSQWRIGAAWTGTEAFVEIRRTTATNQCLDVNFESVTPGAIVQQWTCSGGNPQRFALLAP